MKDTEGAARVQDREKVMEWIKTNKQCLQNTTEVLPLNKQNCHHKYSIVYSHLITTAFTIIYLLSVNVALKHLFM